MLFHLYVMGKISKKRFMGTLRVLAYGTVVTAGLGALTVKSAIANVNDQTLEMGRKLAGLQDVIPGSQEFRLNGESVFFATSKTDQSVAAVLDRFDEHCNKTRAFDPLTWKMLAETDPAKKQFDAAMEKDGVNKFGVLRKEDAAHSDGVVMCFTRTDGPTNFLNGLQKFAQSGDLHDLGDVRYVHAVHKSDGRTYVQAMWTDGSFNIRKIMPDPGKDAVGSDFANLPRPLHSTRTLTAEALNTPYAARIYETNDAPADVLSTYAEKMYAQGWSSVTSPDVSLDRQGFDGRYFIKPDTAEQAVVSVSKSKVDSMKTQVVVASVALMPSTEQLKVKEVKAE